jgi:N6-L-threonylcarbamoyladenine synthase
MFPLLAVETSCDETAAAVIAADGTVAGEVIRTQIDDHAVFGGVVPELASRCHVEAIDGVVAEALARAGTSVEQLGSVAATRGPGLVGSLLVGLSWAQGLALARGIPLLAVNHIEGHLLAPFVGCEAPSFPFVGLVVSGGHTLLVLARGVGDYELLGQTRDDAAGEAFDKGARLLGLPYPGGVAIDRLSKDGDPAAIKLPRGMKHSGDLAFSFSGLKTAVWQHVQSNGVPEGVGLADLCASLQEAIVDVLVHKTRKAVESTGVERVVLTGGVAANSRLRDAFEAAAEQAGWTLHRAERRWCTDNAAMIGYVARLRLLQGERSPLDADASPGLSLGSVR